MGGIKRERQESPSWDQKQDPGDRVTKSFRVDQYHGQHHSEPTEVIGSV